MDVGLHQRAERSIYHPMTGQRLNTLEAFGDELYDEMSSPILRARMTRVSMALVDDLEQGRSESGFEPRPYSSDTRVVHSSIWIASAKICSVAGYFSECDSLASARVAAGAVRIAIQAACTTATSSSSPVMPNNLKLTQTDSEK